MDSSEKNNTFNQAFINLLEPILKDVLEKHLLPEIRGIVEEKNHPEYYASKEVREQFGLTSHFLYKYRKDGLIEYVQIGRKIVYPYEEIQRFLADHTNPKKSNTRYDE